MKKIGIALALALSSAAFAFDFGGLLTNDSAYKTDSEGDFNLVQQNSASLWARQNFDKSGENYFTVEGIYNFEGDFSQEDDGDKFTNFLDVNLLEINFSKKFDSSKLSFELGRFYFSDLSALVFYQNADGAKISFQNNYFRISAYGSYTGLLNANNTKIISANPKQFYADGEKPAVQDFSSDIFTTDSDKIYDLNEKYALADLTLSFPYFAASQTFSAEFLGAFRLEDDKYNRMYASFGFDGPVYKSLFYNVSSTFEFLNYEYEETAKNGTTETKSKSDVANLSKIGLAYYFSKASFGVNGVYASGNQGPLSPFVGFTKITSSYSLQDFLYSGIIKAGADATLKPVNNLLFAANCSAIFNALSGDKDDNEFEKIEYYGFEWAASVTWQVKSDFQLGLSASQFIDKDNTDFIKKTYINLHAALAF